MNLVKSCGIKVALLLLLHFLKNYAGNQSSPEKYLAVPVLTSLQLLVLSWMILTLLLYWVARKWRFGKTESVGLLLALALLATTEIGLDAYFNRPFLVPPSLTGILQQLYNTSEYQTLTAKPGAAVFDKDIFYTLAPSVDYRLPSREYSFSIHTNRLGLRDQDSNLVRPEAIFLGDSFIMGYGIAQDSALPQRLARLTGIKTLNAGIPSYGTAREIHLLNRLDTSALRWLFIAYCSNDESENAQYIHNGFQLEISPESYFNQLQQMEKWKTRYFPGKYTGLLVNLAKKRWSTRLPSALQDDYKLRADISDEAIINFLTLVNRLPLDFERTRVVVIHLDAYVSGTDPFLTRCRELSAQIPHSGGRLSRVSFVNLNSQQDKEDYFYFDWHLKASGHRKAAAALAQWLETQSKR